MGGGAYSCQKDTQKAYQQCFSDITTNSANDGECETKERQHLGGTELQYKAPEGCQNEENHKIT